MSYHLITFLLCLLFPRTLLPRVCLSLWWQAAFSARIIPLVMPIHVNLLSPSTKRKLLGINIYSFPLRVCFLSIPVQCSCHSTVTFCLASAICSFPPLHMMANPSAKPIRLNCMDLHSFLHDSAELVQEVVLLEQEGSWGDFCLTSLSFDAHRVWWQSHRHKDLLVGLKAEGIHWN